MQHHIAFTIATLQIQTKVKPSTASGNMLESFNVVTLGETPKRNSKE